MKTQEQQEKTFTLTDDQLDKLMDYQAKDDTPTSEKIRARALINVHNGESKMMSCYLVGEADEQGFTPSRTPLAQASLNRLLDLWEEKGPSLDHLKDTGKKRGSGRVSKVDEEELRTFLRETVITPPPTTMRKFGQSEEETEYTPSTWSATDLCDKWNDGREKKEQVTVSTFSRAMKNLHEKESTDRQQKLFQSAKAKATKNGYTLGDFKQHEHNSDLFVATCQETDKTAYVAWPTSATCPFEMFGEALEVPRLIQEPESTGEEAKEEAEQPKAAKKPKKATKAKKASTKKK